MAEVYKGYRFLDLTDDELANYYSGLYEFPDLFENEYGLVRSNGEIVAKFCYQDGMIRQVRYPVINDHYGNIIKARNEYQNCAIDLLQDPSTKVKVILGKAGSGKDFLMTSAALALIDKGKFKKIVFIRPNLPVAGIPDIGFLCGDVGDKLDWTLGPIRDKIGDDRMRTLINKGGIELTPLIHLRGRSFENSIIYITEGQNIDTSIAKLLLSRIGEGSELWLNGDTRQVDRAAFAKDNGVVKMIDRLSGNRLFGYVYLPITERSAAADLANLLDD